MHQWRYLIPGELIVMDDELALDGIWTLAMVLGHQVGQYEGQHFRRMIKSKPDGWISVQDRLPTLKDAVNGKILCFDAHVREQFTMKWDNAEIKYATHWKPLGPDPKTR